MTRIELTERLLADKAIPILRVLKTTDGKVLMQVLIEGVEELRATAGRPIDPYALAMAEGAQRLIDKLTTFRDAAEKVHQRSTQNV